MSHPGLRAHLPAFAHLMLANAFVGAMVGLERTLLPDLLDADASALLGLVAAFGVAKALANLAAGWASDRFGRRPVLLAGWALMLPVPWLLASGFAVPANLLLGLGQGLAWSATVIMKIDLAGPRQRGLAMGLNEFAGYLAVALVAALTGYLASTGSPTGTVLQLGTLLAVGGSASALLAGETQAIGALEAAPGAPSGPTTAEVLRRTSLSDPTLSTVSHAGLVNNLGDGVAWVLLPLWYAQHGLDLPTIGALAALYPGVWALLQLVSGPLSDRVGRKPLLVAGMAAQAVALVVIALGTSVPAFAVGAALMGAGTAAVYPTFVAAIGDATAPSWRARAVGVYRLWRDLGYAGGALLAGPVAHAAGLGAALATVAALMAAASLWLAVRMPLRPASAPPTPRTAPAPRTA